MYNTFLSRQEGTETSEGKGSGKKLISIVAGKSLTLKAFHVERFRMYQYVHTHKYIYIRTYVQQRNVCLDYSNSYTLTTIYFPFVNVREYVYSRDIISTRLKKIFNNK